MTSIDYHLLSATGGLIATYGDRDRALKAARGLRETFPGIHVEEVVTTVTRTVLYRSRVKPFLSVVRAA